MKLLLIFYPVNCLFSLHGSFLGNWLFSFHFSAVRLMLVHTIWEPFLSLLLPHIILDACVCTFLKIKNHRIFLFIYVFVYSGLHWAFVALAGLPLVVVNGSRTLLRCEGFSLKQLLLLWSTGSRHTVFSGCRVQALERGLRSSPADGILLDQGLKPCHAPCIGSWILIPSTTREVPCVCVCVYFLKNKIQNKVCSVYKILRCPPCIPWDWPWSCKLTLTPLGARALLSRLATPA